MIENLDQKVRDEQAAKCRAAMGEAHDAHMEINDECPWCGAFR